VAEKRTEFVISLKNSADVFRGMQENTFQFIFNFDEPDLQSLTTMLEFKAIKEKFKNAEEKEKKRSIAIDFKYWYKFSKFLP
jgi:hypothetical protein